ncbi:hypothetical protein [Aeromicrobium sp. P5_D10]
MTTLARKFSTLAVAVCLAVAGLTLTTSVPALACTPGAPNCPPPSDDGGGSDDGGTLSSGTTQETYQSPAKSCSVYANGSGMGMYCVSVGGGTSKTLRERFGDQKLQRCRYDEIPPSIPAPFNANPDRGRYMLMSCINNIDFDTYTGGPNRTVDISLVFVENGTDIADRNNPISKFLWDAIADSDVRLPVPFMRTRPNATPLVGIPTYFTFNWLDPVTKQIVGPTRQLTEQGVTVRARVAKIVIDPNQAGVKAVTCDPSTPYIEGASPKNQPAAACSIVFPRSSASARKFATKEIPENIKDAFYADVRVTWEITYGESDGAMQELGDGFTMRIRQVLPVQEVQAPNQPPAVIY